MAIKPEILMYFHCKMCLEEKPDTLSAAEWARIGAGWTKKGLQIWCGRHQKNIINLDFLGQQVKPIP